MRRMQTARCHDEDDYDYDHDRDDDVDKEDRDAEDAGVGDEREVVAATVCEHPDDAAGAADDADDDPDADDGDVDDNDAKTGFDMPRRLIERELSSHTHI